MNSIELAYLEMKKKEWEELEEKRKCSSEGLDKANPKQAKKDFDDRDDKDIDNDGDVDDSDEYLHKRRKAISKDVKETTKKEAIEIDDEDGDVVKKKDDDKKKKSKKDTEAEPVNSEEPVAEDSELDELDQSTVVRYRQKAVAQGRTKGAAQAKRMYGRGGKQRNTRREDVDSELDELSGKTLNNYISKSFGDKKRRAGVNKAGDKYRQKQTAKHVSKMNRESYKPKWTDFINKLKEAVAPQEMGDNASKGEKEFKDKHIQKVYDFVPKDDQGITKNVPSKKLRPGDNDIGDKKPVK